MADPGNVLAADDIKMATGLDAQLVVADPADIETLLGKVNSLQSAVSEAVAAMSGPPTTNTPTTGEGLQAAIRATRRS